MSKNLRKICTNVCKTGKTGTIFMYFNQKILCAQNNSLIESLKFTIFPPVPSGLYSTLRRGLAFPLISAGAINSGHWKTAVGWLAGKVIV